MIFEVLYLMIVVIFGVFYICVFSSPPNSFDFVNCLNTICSVGVIGHSIFNSCKESSAISEKSKELLKLLRREAALEMQDQCRKRLDLGVETRSCCKEV